MISRTKKAEPLPPGTYEVSQETFNKMAVQQLPLEIKMDQPVTPEQVTAIDKLVAPEFATGNWETVESELLKADFVEIEKRIVIYGDQLLDEAAAEPTLDRWLDNSPKIGNPVDYPSLVVNLQWKRKTYITAEQKKKEPKTDE